MLSGANQAKILKAFTAWRETLRDPDLSQLRAKGSSLFDQQATVHMCHPFGDQNGVSDWVDSCFEPLMRALPDLERRDTIVIHGLDQNGEHWIGCCGYYCGTFVSPLLDIPPTGQFTHMRFHEFYRVTETGIDQVQAIWDLVEVMMQADAWPISPSLGREGLVPSPATSDGLKTLSEEAINASARTTSEHVGLVTKMLNALMQHPAQGGPEVMNLPDYWHKNTTWYGPAGIGTCRGLTGFRHWHQIPFLNAMPDRGKQHNENDGHLFGQDNYVAVTGWPNMRQTLSADGWLGIAPSGQQVTLRSLDFWRIENGKIAENWVLVDLLDLYAQVGVDVFARLREFNKARNLGTIELPREQL
ncbi:nuclear transport factor 2 family protein [Enterovibrio coralii]|uniref:Polyketide cyclase n=1 Tax=Enterovibrio coralii TaxID=294935 RepID=A0A135IC35_9GAMM|nr:ester cyclase [Enterovibrio coralii]KXF82999.1 polyketide cyclase [Enterovibrio coralii]